MKPKPDALTQARAVCGWITREAERVLRHMPDLDTAERRRILLELHCRRQQVLRDIRKLTNDET